MDLGLNPAADSDHDLDGHTDADEVLVHGTDPTAADSDRAGRHAIDFLAASRLSSQPA